MSSSLASFSRVNLTSVSSVMDPYMDSKAIATLKRTFGTLSSARARMVGKKSSTVRIDSFLVGDEGIRDFKGSSDFVLEVFTSFFVNFAGSWTSSVMSKVQVFGVHPITKWSFLLKMVFPVAKG